MNAPYLRRIAGRTLLFGGAVLAAALLVAGCSGDADESGSSDAQQPSQSQQQQAPGQMTQPGSPQALSSSDVSEEQVQKAARIAMSVQMGTRADRMKMRKEMQEKYGDPQQMDSTQKAEAQKEMRRRQMEMQKKQMKIVQEETEKEGMDPQTFQQIMRSAQKDSTLQNRLRTAMKAQMQKQMKEQMQERMQQGAGQQNQ